jgi:hypothetical protein
MSSRLFTPPEFVFNFGYNPHTYAQKVHVLN